MIISVAAILAVLYAVVWSLVVVRGLWADGRDRKPFKEAGGLAVFALGQVAVNLLLVWAMWDRGLL